MQRTPVHEADRSVSVPAASDKYVSELDGIRAVAVGFVVLAHYGLGFIVPGAFGVTLFFFLSGYLITTLFFAEYHSNNKINIPQFYVRRWLRLTPSLGILVLLAIALYRFDRASVGGQLPPIGTTASALLYYSNYYDLFWDLDPFRIIPFGICWSLAVEEHFYLVWPWLIRKGAAHPQRLCQIVVVLCVSVLVWRVVAHSGFGLTDDYTYEATDCRIDSILFGALLRLLYEIPSAPQAARLLRAPLCRLAGAVAMLSTFLIRDDDFRQTFRYSLQGLALMPFFAAILTDSPTTVLRRLLSSRPMVLIGRLSYSIYLLHLLARTPGEVYFGGPFRAGAVISGILFTAAGAYGLYIFVERPVGKFRHRFKPHAHQSLSPLAEASGLSLPQAPTPNA